jgi:predicted transcriptional regulator of viral defense system
MKKAKRKKSKRYSFSVVEETVRNPDYRNYSSGRIEEHDIDGQKIRIYSLAKTLADCFKFRNQIGMDIARSALKNALEQKKVDKREIMKYATICRVTNIIKPILETLI